MRKESLVLLTTSLAAFLTPFISSSISFSIPRIGDAFGLSFYQAALLPLVILIPLASFMLLLGRVSDALGRVRFLRIGLSIFTVGAILSILSRDFVALVLSLFVVGVGASMISANATAIVSYHFRTGRGFALGINAMSVYLGLTMSPFLSGVLIEFIGWESIFLVVIPIAILSLLLSFVSLNSDIRGAVGMRVYSSLLFSILLVSISTYLSFGYLYGFLTLLPLLLLFIIALALFIVDETRSENPLISGRMMEMKRTFLASNIAALLNYVGTFSIVFVFSVYLQVVLKVSPFLSGIYILPEPVMMVLMSPVSGRLSDKLGSRGIASTGMVAIGISFLLFFILREPSFLEIVLLLTLLGAGFGLFSAPNTNSVMGSIKLEFSGLASGFLGTMRFIGQLSSIILASYILSLEIPRKIMVGIFSGIYVSIGNAYYQNFISGFRWVMLLSSVISLIGAIFSFLR